MVAGYCFSGEDLKGSRVEHVDSAARKFEPSTCRRRVFRGFGINHVVMRGGALFDVDIHGEIVNLTINAIPCLLISQQL